MAHCSVLILTLHEEDNLPRCLESLRWCDDVVVYDSNSTDKTVEIATQAGARVIQRKFDNWASHQNWGVQNIEFKHPWVYYIDADEVMTPELAEEVQRIAGDPNTQEAAFRVRRKDMFFGRWIKRSSMYPVWIVRLFRPEKIRWERLVNPVAIVDGKEGNLSGQMIHYVFNMGLRAWIARHNQYATFEAQESLLSAQNTLAAALTDTILAGLFLYRDMELIEVTDSGVEVQVIELPPPPTESLPPQPDAGEEP